MRTYCLLCGKKYSKRGMKQHYQKHVREGRMIARKSNPSMGAANEIKIVYEIVPREDWRSA